MDKCKTCNKEYSPSCDWDQGRCPHHPPMLTDYHFRFYNLFQTIKGFLNVDIEVQPKDTSKGHFYVSVVKSAVRVGAGAALIMAGLPLVGWLFIFAEILGIVEEIV